MKKLILLLAVISSALVFASCSKMGGSYDNSYASQILGEWKVEKGLENGKAMDFEGGVVLAFTYSHMIWYYSDGSKHSCSYYVDEHDKTIYAQDQDYVILKLTSSQLVLAHDYSDNHQEIYFTRVK